MEANRTVQHTCLILCKLPNNTWSPETAEGVTLDKRHAPGTSSRAVVCGLGFTATLLSSSRLSEMLDEPHASGSSSQGSRL